jgi:hypothetical protein
VNRVEDDDAVCVMCGGVIIDLKPDLKMCSKCQKIAEAAALKQIKNFKSRTGNVKRIVFKTNKLKKR